VAYERSHNSYEKPMRTQCLSRAKSPRKLQTNSIKITATEARDEKWTCMGRALSMADQWGARILSTFVHFCPLLSTSVHFCPVWRIGQTPNRLAQICLLGVRVFSIGRTCCSSTLGRVFFLPKSTKICQNLSPKEAHNLAPLGDNELWRATRPSRRAFGALF